MKKYIDNSFFDFNTNSEIKLDCYQNCLLNLLELFKFDITFLGAQWPWSFYIKEDKFGIAPVIRNKYMAEKSIIEKIYGISVIRKKIDSSEAVLIKKIKEKIKVCPVIINVDEYMVTHHYFHIYNKQHGPHSLLLYDYNYFTDSFKCIDSFPDFKGEIKKDKVISGFYSYPEEAGGKYILTYFKITQFKDINEKKIFEEFCISLKEKEKENYKSLTSLVEIINIQINNLNTNELLEWLNSFTKGSWIWEIERNAFLTIKYLNRIGINQEIINEIEEINLRLNKTMKKMYKLIVSRKISFLANIMTDLEKIVESEDKIKERILQ